MILVHGILSYFVYGMYEAHIDKACVNESSKQRRSIGCSDDGSFARICFFEKLVFEICLFVDTCGALSQTQIFFLAATSSEVRDFLSRSANYLLA